MPQYTMSIRGTTQGRVTGTKYYFKPGTEIVAPDGEFDHMADHTYSARVVDTTRHAMTAEPSEDEGAPRYVADPASDSGWTAVIDRETGEQVGSKERTPEAAQSKADELNAAL